MDAAAVQTLTAAIIVLGAVLFLGRRAWRTFAAARRRQAEGGGCGTVGACGCGSEASRADESTR